MSQKKAKKQRKLEKEKRVEKVSNFGGKENDFLGIIKQNWKFLSVLLGGIFLLFVNALGGDFVSDDYATIPHNPMIKEFSSLFPDFNLVSLSKYLIAVIFGIESPVPYHLFSLILFLMISVLVFVYTYLLTNKNIAYLTSIIFVVMPIHVESVSWISGVPYLLVSFFILLSLIYLAIYSKTGSTKSLIWAGVFFVLAFFSDRVRSFALIPLFLVYMVAYKNRIKVRFEVGKILVGLLAAGTIMGVIMWPKIMDRLTSVNSGYNKTDGIFYDPFFQYPTTVTKYLQLMFAPTDLTLYHTMYVIPEWINWLVLVLYLGLVAYTFVKHKTMFFALVFIFLATAPSMAPLKVSWLVAERYAFLGSFGFSLFMGLVFDFLRKKYRQLSYTVLALLCLVYGIRILMRNNDWSTNHKLWVNTVQVSPNSHNAWNNIGDDYDKLEDYENAIKGFTQSTVVKNNYADAYHNRANIFYKIGRLDLARESYEIAMYYSQGLYQTIVSLTQIDLIEQKYDLAMEHGKMLIQKDPNNPQSYYVMGVVYAEMGDKEEAGKLFRNALGLSPNFKPALEGLEKLRNL